MKIEVTTDDINRAMKKRKKYPLAYVSIIDCPISNAVTRAARENGIKNLIVNTGRYDIRFRSPNEHIFYVSEPIYHYQDMFVDRFDKYYEVEPISFEIPDDTFSKLFPVEKEIEDSKSGARI